MNIRVLGVTLALELLICAHQGNAFAITDDGLCPALSYASTELNKVQVVCGCAQQYLGLLGKQAAALQTRVKDLIGQPVPGLAISSAGSSVATASDIEQRYRGNDNYLFAAPRTALQPDLRKRVEELVKTTKGITEKMDLAAEATAKNGKLDKATVDAALDRILAAMKSVNDELDELLAKARG